MQDEKLDGIKKDIGNIRDNTGKLFEKNEKSVQRIAALEARADGFEKQATFRGSVSGGLIGGIIIGVRMAWEWIAGR